MSRVFRILRPTALRSSPRNDAGVLLWLEPGTTVAPLEGEQTGDWLRVAADGTAGWVSARDCAGVRSLAENLPVRPLTLAALAAQRRAASAAPVGVPPGLPEHGSGDVTFESFGAGDAGLESLGDRHRDVDGLDDSDFARRPGTRGARPDRIAERTERGRGGRRSPGVSRGPKPMPQQADTVDCSVFGPETLRAGGECLIQVFLHLAEQRAEAERRAQAADSDATSRAISTLLVEVERGQHIRVVLDGRGLTVDESMQELVWRGEPAACQFIVGAAAGTAEQTCYPRIQVFRDTTPIGAVKFALRVTAQGGAQAVGIRGEQAHRYQYAFLSYASADRIAVLRHAQGIKAAGVDFFQDLLSLEPGDQWAQRLYAEIDRCDLFVLFWSTRAKESPWVMKEVLHALQRRNASGGELPHITPLILEVPPPLPPPEELKDIHFNDALAYVIAGIEAASRPGR